MKSVCISDGSVPRSSIVILTVGLAAAACGDPGCFGSVTTAHGAPLNPVSELVRTGDLYAETQTAPTVPKLDSFKLAANHIENVLKAHGYKPEPCQITGDGSALFFIKGETSVIVDLYPSGDLVVILEKGDREDIHELLFDDIGRMLEVIAHGIPDMPLSGHSGAFA